MECARRGLGNPGQTADSPSAPEAPGALSSAEAKQRRRQPAGVATRVEDGTARLLPLTYPGGCPNISSPYFGV